MSAGYFRVDNDILDKYGEQLGAYGLAVYMALSRFANQELVCWPSYETLAKRTGISRRKVISEVNKLVDFGLIEITQQYNPETKEHRSNLFKLVRVGAPQPLPPSAHGALPDAPHAPRTKQKKNYQPNYEIKEKKRNYKPAEYAEFILG